MLIGPAIAPLIGGAVSRYASWRWMQVILGIGAFIAYAFVSLWLPETIHPGHAGIEKQAKIDGRTRHFVLLNPLKSLDLLKSPVLLLSVSHERSTIGSGIWADSDRHAGNRRSALTHH